MISRTAPPVVMSVVACFIFAGCTGRTILDSNAPLPPPVAKAVKAQDDQMHVWFVKPAGDDLTLVAVNRPAESGDRLKLAVTQLLNGPSPEETKAGMGSEIPRGTLLIDLKPKGEGLELNLSRRFASGGGTDSLETRIDQLRKTVADAAGGHKVYLDIEGQRLTQTGGEGLEIPQPLN